MLIVLDEDHFSDDSLRREAFGRIARESLIEAVQTVRTLTRPPDDHHYDELIERYNQIRRFLPTLAQTYDSCDEGPFNLYLVRRGSHVFLLIKT